MQTIKTAVVVVLLMVVLYGAYIAINGSQAELPPELQQMLASDAELEVDVSMGGFSGSDSFAPSPSQANAGGGLSTSGGLTAGPNPFFSGNASPSSIPAPATLSPPKLTGIPSLPAFPSPSSSSSTTTDANPATGTLPPNPIGKGGESPLLAPPQPLATTSSTKEEPNFSLDLGKAERLGSQSTPSTLVTTPVTPGVTAGTASQTKETTASESLSSIPKVDIPPSISEKPWNTAEAPTALTKAGEPDAATTSDPLPSEPVSGTNKANITGRSFENAKKTALEHVERGEFKEALAKMSAFYNSPELTSEQSQDLINLLDSLAGETIYSRRHLLDMPYVVGPGETVESIAKRFEIPVELLVKINAIDATIGPLPGTKLKVFQGPFRAEVDVNRHEMTVFLGDLYAGRFPVSTGNDPQPKEGVFQVLDKQRHRNYYGKGGVQIDGNDPRNPYGGWWMDLGQDLSIHGSPETAPSDGNQFGCISLSPIDAGDVFSMLSRGSQVTIKR